MGLVVGTALSGHDDDTAGSSCTVEGGGRSILQNRNGLNIIGVERTAGHAVHHIEGTCACGDGPGTADADIGIVTGLAGTVHNHHTGHLALQHVADIGSGDVAEFLTAHGNHGAGKFRFLLGSITQHDHLVQSLGVGCEGNVDDRAATDGFRNTDITQGGERDGSVGRSLDHKFSVIIGNGSVAA